MLLLLLHRFLFVTSEGVDSSGDGALVGEVARDATLVLRARLANERRVENQTVLGRVAFGLQRTEESLREEKN